MRFEPPRPKNDEERILPLVNVVFLLLIFFMLAGRITASDPFQVNPPQSVSDAAPGTRDLVVSMSAGGRLALDGEIMNENNLKGAVAIRLSENGGAQVRLKADGRAEAASLVAVMELLREAGVERLKLLTVSPPVGGGP